MHKSNFKHPFTDVYVSIHILMHSWIDCPPLLAHIHLDEIRCLIGRLASKKANSDTWLLAFLILA